MLARLPLFATLDRHCLRELVDLGTQQAFHGGDALITQDQPGAGLFVILRGRVRVTQAYDFDGAREEACVGSGALFGERSLLDERPPKVTVSAVEPTLAFVIPILNFRAALKANVEAAIRLLVLLSQHAVRMRWTAEC